MKCNFLQYHGLLSAIASVWKKYLKQDEQAATVNLLAVDKLTCKKIYRSLIDHQNFSPPTAEKRLIECGFDIHERQKIYSLPFLVTKQIKLSIFQYNIIHNFLYTNTLGARGFFFRRSQSRLRRSQSQLRYGEKKTLAPGYYTNCILYKMKKVENPHCPFCTKVDHTVSSLFAGRVPVLVLSGPSLLNGNPKPFQE